MATALGTGRLCAARCGCQAAQVARAAAPLPAPGRASRRRARAGAPPPAALRYVGRGRPLPPPPPPSLRDEFLEAIDGELRRGLSETWLPYDSITAAKALAIARALARRGARAGAVPPAPPAIARAALPVYRALLAARASDGGPWRGGAAPPPPPRVTAAAATATYAASGAVDVREEVWRSGPRLAAAVHVLAKERAECERSLASGRLNGWRAENLAVRAEWLSLEIHTLERALRLGDGASGDGAGGAAAATSS